MWYFAGRTLLDHTMTFQWTGDGENHPFFPLLERRYYAGDSWLHVTKLQTEPDTAELTPPGVNRCLL